MPTSSSPGHSGAIPQTGIVWERLRGQKMSAVSEVLGKDESWARKVSNRECGVLIDEIPRLLDALGLKAVEKSRVCVDREYLAGLRRIAGLALTEPQRLQEDWDQ